MNDDRRAQPNEPAKDPFTEALDDLFGAAEPPEPDEPAQEPAATYVPPEPEPAPPLPAYPAASDPTQVPSARPRRSLGRMIAIGCAGLVGLSIACSAVLVVIGLIFGDEEDPGAKPLPQPIVEVDVASRGTEVPAELVPLGSPADLNSDWRVTVEGTIPDATDQVLARNQFNEPPEDGRQFFIASVRVENRGEDAQAFPATLLFRLVNDAGAEYTTFNDYCGVIPEEFPREELQPGEIAYGNVCWSVNERDVDTVVMRSDDFLGEYEEHYFALR